MKMSPITCVVLVTMFCAVLSKPLENVETAGAGTAAISHSIQKRFVNTALTSGNFDASGLNKIRTKRSEEDCEKLELCRLHARSRHSFLATFQLYFVNRENARLWDHQAHSSQDCDRRFSCYEK